MKKIREYFKIQFRNIHILTGGFVALVVLGIMISAYSPILTIMRGELSISYMESGLFMSSFFCGYAIGQIPWGYACDRFGNRRVIVASLLGTALSTALLGLSSDIGQAIVSRFLAGSLGAGIFVPVIRLTSVWFPISVRGKAFGILTVGTSFGLAIASYTSPILAINFGWRGSLMLLGLLGILSSGIVLLTLKKADSDAASRDESSLREPVRSRNFWILGYMQFIRLGTNYTFIAWLPLFLQEEYGLNFLTAGIALLSFNLAGLLASIVGGLISDRKGERFVIFLSFLILSLAVTVLVHANTILILQLGIFVLGWFVNMSSSPMFAITPRLWTVEKAGKIFGVHNTLAAIGALVLPFLLGYVRDLTGSYDLGWIALSLFLMVAALLTLIIKR